VACSPELGLLTYGHCRDKALNNLADELLELSSGTAKASRTGDERKSIDAFV